MNIGDWHALPVERLIELLRQLPADTLVGPNAVGNLAVVREGDQEYMGYVDFRGDGCVDLMP